MSEKLTGSQWRESVKAYRSQRKERSFTETVKLRKGSSPAPLKANDWKKRVELSRQNPQPGGRYRALAGPQKQGRKQRIIGGMLKSNTPRARPNLTEGERQARAKTGHLTPKKGINAEGWSYDHRKATKARRVQGAKQNRTASKKGINATGWNYDHRKTMAEAKTNAGRMARPTTHVSKFKLALREQSGKAKTQPTQPKQPSQKKEPIKTVTPRRTK